MRCQTMNTIKEDESYIIARTVATLCPTWLDCQQSFSSILHYAIHWQYANWQSLLSAIHPNSSFIYIVSISQMILIYRSALLVEPAAVIVKESNLDTIYGDKK